jgi:hypothetical protein
VAQGEEAAFIFLQRNTWQVQGLYKHPVMAFGIVPDYDAFVIDLLFNEAAQIRGSSIIHKLLY